MKIGHKKIIQPPTMPSAPSSSSSFSSDMLTKIIVETKTYDGGCTSVAASYDAKRKHTFHSSSMNMKEERQNHFDAFSYYSIQSNRMSMFDGPRQQELHPLEEDNETSADPCRSRRASTSSIKTAPTAANSRRTRVSFEMHPSLFMLDAPEINEQQRRS